jgi:hypothetical protein
VKIFYLLFDAQHPSYKDALALATDQLAVQLPGNILSVNTDKLGTRSLVKLAVDDKITADDFKALGTGLVLDEFYSSKDHKRAQLLVSDVTWQPAAEVPL